MAYLTWTTELDVGVGAMNDEHRQLIDQMNCFVDAAEAGDSRRVLKELDGLEAIVVKHFRNEEAYMQSIGFAGFESHRRIHEKLLLSFGEHAKSIRSGGAVTDAFKAFLKMWLKAHIMGIDTKYGAHSKRTVA